MLPYPLPLVLAFQPPRPLLPEFTLGVVYGEAADEPLAADDVVLRGDSEPAIGALKSKNRKCLFEIPANSRCVVPGMNARADTTSPAACCCRMRGSARECCGSIARGTVREGREGGPPVYGLEFDRARRGYDG